MKRVRPALAVIAIAAMTVGLAAPAGAQEEEPPEATLGLAVNATEGPPGALVLGKVNTDDVAEGCVTGLEEFQSVFVEWLEGPHNELFDVFFPGAMGGPPVPGEIENHAQLAQVFLFLISAGIGFNVGGAAEDALSQTFVLTFADIATQEPVGERGDFNPDTGEGSVVVPDIDQGLWAVAAACVGPTFDLDAAEAGVREAGAFLEGIGFPVPLGALGLSHPDAQAFMADFLDSEITPNLVLEFAAAVGPNLVEPIMVPNALGAVLFCVLDDQGNCPDGPVEPPPGEQIDVGDSEAGPARPIMATPSFTG